MRRVILVPVFLCLLILSGGQFQGAPARAETGTETGLPIPRYVTIRAREANLRAGPGVRYPVEWVLMRPNMPVEILAEFDTWRKVRDFEGTEGWVHKSMLSGRRSVMVIGRVRPLRRGPSVTEPTLARMEPGVIGWLEECRPEWCEVEISGISGWIHRSQIWGVRVDEALE